MAERTGISWCDATWNPWWGCQKISPACDNCYAERDAHRFAPGRVLWGAGSDRRTFGDAHWEQPLAWARRSFCECMSCGWRGPTSKAGVKNSPAGFDRDPGTVRTCPQCREPTLKEARRRVFCASMGDWLDLDAPLDELVRLLDTIRRTPELDWLLLSKRIGNWRKRLDEAAASIADEGPAFLGVAAFIELWRRGQPPENVWLGATVINQAEADRDVLKLLAVPALVHFLSIEPMLGPVNMLHNLPTADDQGWRYDALRGLKERHNHARAFDPVAPNLELITGLPRIKWIIAGGESGPRARPMHPDWVRNLRDRCAAAGVPFHFKQWGEWGPTWTEAHAHHGLAWYMDHPDPAGDKSIAGTRVQVGQLPNGDVREALWPIQRHGKAAAGRLLDGVEHNGFPA